MNKIKFNFEIRRNQDYEFFEEEILKLIGSTLMFSECSKPIEAVDLLIETLDTRFGYLRGPNEGRTLAEFTDKAEKRAYDRALRKKRRKEADRKLKEEIEENEKIWAFHQ